MISLPTEPADKPTPGQKTERQWPWIGYNGRYGSGGVAALGAYGAGLYEGNAGTILEGIYGVWPHWGGLLHGSYGTYRAMLRHPTIAYLFGQILSPIAASEWTLDADNDAPQQAKDWVTDNILHRRGDIVPHALRAIVFGNSPFEVVWRGSASAWLIERFVALLPDQSYILRDDAGNGPVCGLQNGAAKLSLAEMLFILNSADVLGNEPGNDYGRSRNENIRDTAWAGWIDTARKLAELEDRVSGVVPVPIVPAGFAANGKTYAQNAFELLPALCHPRSQGAVLEMPGLDVVDGSVDPGRLKQLTTTLTTLDMGNRGPSQDQMRQKLEYWDKLFARGLMRGERAVFQGQHGNMADARQHSQNSEPDSEAIDNMIVSQVNAGPATTGLTLNFGQNILKVCRGVKASPLVNEEKQQAMQLIDMMMQNTAIAPMILRFLDGTSLFDLAGVPVNDIDWATIATPPQPQPAKQSTDGNDDAPLQMSDISPRIVKRIQRMLAA